MPWNKSSTTSNRSIRLAMRVGATTLGVAILGFSFWPLIGGSALFESRTIADLMKSAKFIHPVEATVELCGEVACIEGWKTRVGNFLRFKGSGQAEYWAAVLGDGCRRDGEILVDFTGLNLDVSQKKNAVDVLYSRKDWY
jgi:hypothetical protein